MKLPNIQEIIFCFDLVSLGVTDNDMPGDDDEHVAEDVDYGSFYDLYIRGHDT